MRSWVMLMAWLTEYYVKGMSESCERPWEKSFRLPETLLPDHYELYIFPDLSTRTFSGHVTISLTSLAPRDHFLVHSQWLTITDTSLVKVEEDQRLDVPITEAFEYEPNEFWVVRTQGVEPGSFRLTLHFSGSLTRGILGFYYSEYTAADGTPRGLATTKFEPTYARRAFPCLDEPSFKSTYSLRVVRPSKDYRALSNMPIESEVENSPSAGFTEVVFEKSVPMVTYLVCFIVCDFTYKETTMESGMPFRVYAPAGRIENTDFALEVGKNVLQMYEKMFDLPFPLPKSDMAAIPDYSSGATEHWGLVTFRETSIFFNHTRSSAANKERVATVISHEMAHQWFGNLVTLKWWDDLWLNEGFATYMEYKGAAHLWPSWDMSYKFVSLALNQALKQDGRLSSHPIILPINTTDGINAMFDTITYKKGGSLLRMLEDFMGKSFQVGLNTFLKKYAYKNAITQDLWRELNAAWASHVPQGEKGDVGAIMDTWTRQMGYPVVTVTRSSPSTFTLTQQRFLLDPKATYDPKESKFQYKWDVPVSYMTSTNSTIQRAWLYHEDSSLTLNIIPEVTWMKVNLEHKGFYRVNYEPEMWRQLWVLCSRQALTTADRAGLYDDVFALANAGLLSYSVALDFSVGLSRESDYVPWDAVAPSLVDIHNLLTSTNAFQPFREYMAGLVEPLYTTLGWTDEGDHLQRLLKTDVVMLACLSGSETCLKTASEELDKWILDTAHPLPLGTRRQVYRWGVVREGTQLKWEAMWQRAKEEQSSTETDNLYFGMANFQDTAILQRYIQLAMDKQNVRSQDFLHILQYISSNPAGTDLVWSWVRSNWKWLVDRYTLNDRYLGQLIPSIARYFATRERLTEMEELFKQHPEAGAGEQYRRQALETVRYNIHWLDTNAATILAWLHSPRPVLPLDNTIA